MRPVIASLILVLALPSSAADVETRRDGTLVFEDVPPIPERIADRMGQYRNTRSAQFESWLGDDAILIDTRFGETAQIHRVSEPMGARQQLTFYDEPVTNAEAAPGGDGFLFTKDVGGDEFYQIHHFDLATGQRRLLTDGESRNQAMVWANDGEHFAFASNMDDGVNTDVYIGSLAGPDHIRMLVKGDGAWFPVNFSADDSRLLIFHYVSINENYLYVADTESGELTPVNPSEEPVGHGDAVLAPDGETVYFSSDQEGEFRTLWAYDIASGEKRPLSEDIPWDVTDIQVSDDGRRLAFVVNAGGRSRLVLHDLEEDRRLEGPELPVGRIYSLGFSPDSQKLAISLATPRDPMDVWVYGFETGELTRWTRSEVGGLDTSRFAMPELIQYPAARTEAEDPDRIPAFVYRPEAEGPHPVIVYIHGGPESQFRPGFYETFQYYINELDFALVAPNVRGSAGYGKSYLQMDNGYLRENSVADIGALLDWIAEQPDLDQERVVVYGGSYGGYMVLASMVHFDERLMGGIDVVGISNFVTFLENTKSYRRDLRRQEYGDERDPAMREHLQSISPNNHADEIDKPLLVIQGLNDPRVPASESEQMVAEIRDQGGDVWYLLAEDEGHGFKKKSNRDAYYQTVALFLETLLESPGD